MLLQAVYGGDSHVPSLFFDPNLWALAPLDERPILVTGTDQQWTELADKWSKSKAK